MNRTWPFLLYSPLIAAPVAHGQFAYSTNGDTITLTGYSGPGGDVTISNFVTSIGFGAFMYSHVGSVTIPDSVGNVGQLAFSYSGLTSVLLGNGVTNLGEAAFGNCGSLTTVTFGTNITSIPEYTFQYDSGLQNLYFLGNAPNIDPNAFFYSQVTFNSYYIPGTSGWSSTLTGFSDTPVSPWNPSVRTADGSFGVLSNSFGFNITGTNNFTVVVEACTNLGNPVWTPIETLTLVNGSYYFSDPQWTNYPVRFYGLGMP